MVFGLMPLGCVAVASPAAIVGVGNRLRLGMEVMFERYRPPLAMQVAGRCWVVGGLVVVVSTWLAKDGRV